MANYSEDNVDLILDKSVNKGWAYYLGQIFFGRPMRLMILLGFVTIILVPVMFIISTSLKVPLEIRLGGSIFPQQGLVTVNWTNAFRNVPLVRFLFNSTATAVLSTILALLISVPAVYTIVRFRTGGWFLPSWILGTYVMPPIVVSVPIFAMVKLVNLQNTLAGLILIHAMANMPICVWLIDSYVRTIPKELEQAAWIDGYGKFQTLWKVVVPLIKPGITAAGVISMILSWNEFLFALILTYSVKSNTFPIGISRFIGEHGRQYGEMSAAALAGMIPIYILVFFTSKSLVEGLTRGGVKG
jgi:multiple sugar transport system permease protein